MWYLPRWRYLYGDALASRLRPVPLFGLLAGALACATSGERPARSGSPQRQGLPLQASAPAPREPAPPPSTSADGGPRASPPAASSTDEWPAYPPGARHSPVTAELLQLSRQLVVEHPDLSADRFFKVGDSITKSPKFLACFDRTKVDGAASLSEPLRAALSSFRASPLHLFSRESLSADDGWSAWQPLAGAPPPLERELAAVAGRFALVQLGTNDIETSRVTTFARRLLRLVDRCLELGVLPLLSTIPERRDRDASRLKVPRFNAAIRAIAQARQIPLADLHLAFEGLPNTGLSSDGIHPGVYRSQGLMRACDFGPEGLRQGFNVKNLLSLEALERARALFVGELPASEAAGEMQERPAGHRFAPADLPFFEVRGADTASVDRVCDQSPADPDDRATLSYELSFDRPGPLEVLALGLDAAEPLAIEVVARTENRACVGTGRGFTRRLLATGRYSVVIHSVPRAALVALLPGRNGAS